MGSLQRRGIVSEERTENPKVIVSWKASRNSEISVIEMEIQGGRVLYLNVL